MSKKVFVAITVFSVLCTACSTYDEQAITIANEELGIEEESSIVTTEQGDASKDNIESEAEAEVKEEAEEQVDSCLIEIPAMSQYPEYINGCEMTSLAMLVNYAELPYDREQLIQMLPVDPTPIVTDEDGSIVEWGDPNHGFVGDITGDQIGYGVYHQPIYQLVNQISNGKALDLSGQAFADIEHQIASGNLVIVWTSSSFAPVDEWMGWNTSTGEVIQATFHEHAVLLVGYSDEYVYLNDPISGSQSEQVSKQPFIESWEQLGRQAVTLQAD